MKNNPFIMLENIGLLTFNIIKIRFMFYPISLRVIASSNSITDPALR